MSASRPTLHVRYSPESGHSSARAACLLSANSGLMRRSKLSQRSMSFSEPRSSYRLRHTLYGSDQLSSPSHKKIAHTGLLNHLIRPRHERLWNHKTERLGSLEIYHKVEPSGLLRGQVGGLRAFQDFGHVSGGSSEHILDVRPIGHQATINCELPRPAH